MGRAAVLTAVLVVLEIACAASREDTPLPVSLTNTNGQDLQLLSMNVKAAVHGPLSLVEVDMVFENPYDRQMEGKFTYLLPAGASISRFAKDVNGELMEGEVVERQKARQVYREILHTLRDPALLEQDQGNRFSARVFPIPPKSTARILLSYSVLLPLRQYERRLRIPLAGLPSVGELNVNLLLLPVPGEEVEVMSSPGSPQQLRYSEDARSWRLDQRLTDAKSLQDIDVKFFAAGHHPGVTRYGLRAGQYQMTCVQPDELKSEPTSLDGAAGSALVSWHFYVDTSASTADGFSQRLDILDDTLVEIKEQHAGDAPMSIELRAFDLSVSDRLIYDTRMLLSFEDFRSMVRGELDRRGPLGATDLGRALAHIAHDTKAASWDEKHTYVLVSDGIPSVGYREMHELSAPLKSWPVHSPGQQRTADVALHALVIGTKKDPELLTGITRLARGRVLDLSLASAGNELELVVRKLQAPIGGRYVVENSQPPAGVWTFPLEFHDIGPGDEIIFFTRLLDKIDTLSDFSDLLPPIPPLRSPAVPPGSMALHRVDPSSEPHIVNTQDIADISIQVVDSFAALLERESHVALMAAMEEMRQDALVKGDEGLAQRVRDRLIRTSVKCRVLQPPFTAMLVLETEQDFVRYGIDRNALGDILVVGPRGVEVEKARHTTPGNSPTASSSPYPGSGPWKGESLAGNRPVLRGGDPSNAREHALSKEGDDGTELLYLGGDPSNRLEDSIIEEGDDEDERLYLEVPPSLMHRYDGEVNGNLDEGDETRNAEASSAQGARAARLRWAHQPSDLDNPPTPAGERYLGEPAAPLPGQHGDDVFRFSKIPLPPWVQRGLQKSQTPDGQDLLLGQLYEAVAANPFDRTLRNALAQTLADTGKWPELLQELAKWAPFDPANVQLYEFYGQASHQLGDRWMALRAYSSIAEVAPSNHADLNRAGYLMLSIGEGLWAVHFFEEALKQREDNPNTYRGLALAYWKLGKHQDAVTTLEAAMGRSFHGRYGDLKRVLSEELQYVLESWKHQEDERSEAAGLLRVMSQFLRLSSSSLDGIRVTLSWDTDANDVDLHVVDPNREECYYEHRATAIGLELYSDQTQGLGPEVIRMQGQVPPGDYHIGVKYYSAGPMGLSRGILVVIKPSHEKAYITADSVQVLPFTLIPRNNNVKYVTSVVQAELSDTERE